MLSNILGCHPVDIHRELCKGLAPGWESWDPKTLVISIGVPMSEIEQDKVLSVQALCANPGMALAQGLMFEKLVLAFNNVPCVTDAHQPPAVEELCYAVRQITAVLKAALGGTYVPEFISEIPGYVAAAAKYNGWVALPKSLEFAAEALRAINGMAYGSDKYAQYQVLTEAVQSVIDHVGDSVLTAELILNDPAVLKAEQGEHSELALFAKSLTGAVLYNPTLPYVSGEKTADTQERYLLDVVSGEMYQ